jgi:hypothetical protein
VYDIKWPHITKTYRSAQERAKRDAEAAKAESEKSAKEKAARDAEERKSKSTIEGLAKRKQHFESEIFEVKRAINKLQSELKNIQTQEEKALAEERARNSWFTYAYSSVFGAPAEPEGAKQERDLQRLQRLASKTIKEKELSREEDKLKEWDDLLSGVEKAIAAEVASSQEKAKRAERDREEARQREELKAWRKRQEEFMEQQRANRAAAEARAAQERAAAEALRRAAEERRKKEEEEQRRREAKELEERRKVMAELMRKAEEAEQRRRREIEEREERYRAMAEMLRKRNAASEVPTFSQKGTKARAPRQTKPTASSSASCQHRGWWDKVEHGSLLCQNCHEAQRRFLFQCPGCQMRACADCRISLKGGKPRKAQPRGNQRPWESPSPAYDESHDQGYDDSFGFDWYD